MEAPEAPVKRAAWWKYFEELPEEEKVQCTICEKKLAYKRPSGSTSGMKKHLKNKHPTQYKTLNNPVLTREEANAHLLNFMTDYHLPLSILDSEDLHTLIRSNVQEYINVSKTTMKNNILNKWGKYEYKFSYCYLLPISFRNTNDWTASSIRCENEARSSKRKGSDHSRWMDKQG